LNRIDEIVVFHALTKPELIKIIDLLVADVAKNAKDKEIYLEVDDKTKEAIIKEGYDPKFGARPLRRAIQKLIENPLSNDILEGKFKPGDIIKAEGAEKGITFTKTGEKPLRKTEPDLHKTGGSEEAEKEKAEAKKAAAPQADQTDKSDKSKKKKTK